VVGEVLANESSRTILRVLSSSKEMTINQISQEINLSIPLVSHHLKKMQEAGVVKVSRVGMSVKGQKMKYYSATNQTFLITPPERQVHTIFNSLRKFSKFAAIGMAGLVSWTMIKPNESIPMQTSVRAGLDTNPEASTSDEWDAAFRTELDPDTESASIIANKEESITTTVSEPEQIPLSPEPEPEQIPSTEPEQIPSTEPSHSGVQDFALQLKDSDSANAGSVSLDRVVYPETYTTSGIDSVDPLIFSILIPIAVVVSGLILERILTRWYNKRKIKKSL